MLCPASTGKTKRGGHYYWIYTQSLIFWLFPFSFVQLVYCPINTDLSLGLLLHLPGDHGGKQGCSGPLAAPCDQCLPWKVCNSALSFAWSLVFMAILPVGREMSRWGQKQHLWLARLGWLRVQNFHFKGFADWCSSVHSSLCLSTSKKLSLMQL